MSTLGIHLIWTTYGTWLPGDSRGHWSPLFDFYGKVLRRGGQLNVPDPQTRIRCVETMTEPPKWLNEGEQAVVANELANHVRSPKSTKDDSRPAAWAAAIEDNHVHLLISPLREDVAKYAGRVKGRSSSEVKKLPQNIGRSRVWSGGYWKVFLYDRDAVEAVKNYIEQHNIRKGLPAAPYDWNSPLDI